ncbi:HAD family phosphatase [Trichocoleus sp. FACHB-591]|uniref:HAD family hydrolase n=1 Tax=Trichocoleus sp. FACHB-591 TaxID=2692872 RepID=UPI001686FC45|nr:HAD family hydrolase [Trichocoleus sp. FACHB-591]MBD2096179.1 HAD family phosphatase [Trichocoleus sp. FACHB-591]
MRYLAIASDYDGTLATKGQVSKTTLAALQRLRESGRKLILVTGRRLDELFQVLPQVDWFDCVVAENGALLYWPSTREEQLLGDRPPAAFIQALQERQVDSLAVGRVIVATWKPYETTVLETIRDLGLELQIIFNKEAVMVLPSGLNKATGLKAALERMELSPQNVVGFGDAENDLAFLNICALSVAVANALPMVKEQADWVTQGSRGDGVAEVIDQLLTSELSI